jgi:hypothetical protein
MPTKTAPIVLTRSGQAGAFIAGRQSIAYSAVYQLAVAMRETTEGSNSFTGTNRAGEAAVVHSIGSVPQRLTEFDATTQNFDLLWAASRRIGGNEVIILVRDKIFIVTIT